MFDSAALDVAVGLSLVFFLFSVMISRINETIASWTNLRHAGLEKALRSLVGDDSQSTLSATNVLNHPLVKALGSTVTDSPPVTDAAPAAAATQVATPNVEPRGPDHPRQTNRLLALTERRAIGTQKLSYLPSRAFSAAVLDLLAPADQEPADPDPLVSAEGAVLRLNDSNPAKQPLLRMLADAHGERDRFRRSLEHWYDDAMDRVSGWYKRNIQRIILVISIVVVVSLNIDTINIAQVLWRAPTERAAVASAAAAQAGAGQPSGTVANQVHGVKALSLPIGWTPPHSGQAVSTDPRHFPDSFPSLLVKLLGMLITVLALSLGAPFWFDALGKLSGLSKSGPKPAKSAA